MKIVWRGLVIVLVLSMGLLGCTQSGYLTIENNSAAGISVSVNGDDENINAGDDQAWEYEFPGFVLNLIQQKSEDVDIDYAGWFVLPDSDTVTVEAGDDITYDVDPDAGVWSVQNNSSVIITQVFITESTNPSWGDNLVSGGIGTGQRADFGPLPPIPFDMRIVDNNGTYWELYNSSTDYNLQNPEVNVATVFTIDSSGIVSWGESGGTILPLSGGSSGSLKVGP